MKILRRETDYVKPAFFSPIISHFHNISEISLKLLQIYGVTKIGFRGTLAFSTLPLTDVCLNFSAVLL
ncbi:MAG: hypothetical protein LBT05_10330 [Planctomycetaceae bacterium]|nr:hypothetical protein [Planctomycetaceae bacterium]